MQKREARTNDSPASNNNGRSLLLRPGEGVESMKKYQVFLIILDICCNLMVDSIAKDAVVILVGFGLQSVSLIINFVMYVMGTASLAMRLGLRAGTIRHHEANVGTIVTYFILTIWWYSLAMRKTWSSVSEHFSFTFVDNPPEDHPLGLSVVRSSVEAGTNLTAEIQAGNSSTVDFHPLWSSSFIALYTAHRTVAVLYYLVYLRTMFVLLNGPLLCALGYSDKGGGVGVIDTPVDLGFGEFDPGRRRMSIETVSSFVNTKEETRRAAGITGRDDDDGEVRKKTKATRKLEFGTFESPVKFAGPGPSEKKINSRRTRKSSEDFSSSAEFC